MLRVEYIRDGLVEEFHAGEWSLAEPITGMNFDSTENLYYLRSCAKPLQATLLIDSNIDLTSEELALCCGSHAGEECHLRVAESIMKKFRLNETMLKCGIHEPLSRTMQNKMIINGNKPSQLHNNCSGKHLGFLALCRKNNWDFETYDSPNHPLQLAIKEKINSMCGVEKEYPMTTDGCGVPILSMPLKNLVRGYINLLNYPQILNAIKSNPYIFGGEDRIDTAIIQNSENLIAKVGAGGLCVVLNVKEKNALAVKIHDASTEARKFAVLELINKLGWGNIKCDNSIRTIAGKIVGQVVISL